VRRTADLVLLPAVTSHGQSAISSNAQRSLGSSSDDRLSTRDLNLSLAVTALIRLRSRSSVN